MKKRIILWSSVVVIVGVSVAMAFKYPSHDRQWAEDQAILPHVTIEEGIVIIEQVRDFTYSSTSEYEVAYKTMQVPLDAIVSVDYLVEPFGTYHGPAHTLLSFGFDTPGGIEYVAVSGEIRKEFGESFSPLKGLFRAYELMYVVGTEEDLIQLRSNYRKDDVYLYPIETTPDRMRALFLSMMKRIQGIEEVPEFYNTFTNNCTTNIRTHVNEIVPGRVPWSWTTILPADSDKFVYDLGLIDTDQTFEEAQAHFFITDIANSVEIGNFSERIRSKR